jgi:hypothetical protein
LKSWGDPMELEERPTSDYKHGGGFSFCFEKGDGHGIIYTYT